MFWLLDNKRYEESLFGKEINKLPFIQIQEALKELNDGTLMVQEDFELVGWDFVSNPSTHGAFMAPLQESKQWAKMAEECGKWCRSQDLMREIIIELN